MIAYLKGKVIKRTDKFIILEVNNIGYEIFLPEKTLTKIIQNQDLELYIYHKQREDAQELYGFEIFVERDFFISLISVSGVGPKSALSVMSIANVDDLKHSISRGDAEMFKKVSGIGSKTAERIVVELKNKLSILDFVNTTPDNGQFDEVFEALNALGFTDSQIREAYKKIPEDLEKNSDRIKFALKMLKK